MPVEKRTHPAVECAKNGRDRVRRVKSFADLRGNKNAT